MLTTWIETANRLLWGDLIVLPLGGGIGLSLMAILLLTAGVYFTLRTHLLPVRLFKDMLRAVCEKNGSDGSLSSFQTLVVSTATRVGMGNLVGVVAAVSLGGAGAVFWMWVTALLGASTAFVESTLAQKYKQPDPLYGGWRGGPAYYLHALAERRQGKPLRRSVFAGLFALSGLLCWCGISQVISNSVSESFYNAFHISPWITTVLLTGLSACIVLQKNASVKSLDVIVPVMAVCYFIMTLYVIFTNLSSLPSVLGRIFSEAFGLRQAAAGGFGAVLMNGIKRGLFSNEAGSGSAPCAAAAAESSNPVKIGLVQALGVLIDTILICSCTAFVMLLAPQSVTHGLQGMDLLQAAMQHHLGEFGVVFIAVTLALFSFSTFIGVLFYARSNVAYLFGDRWWCQTAYKLLALAMLLVGGVQAYTVVWDLGDVGIGLMTIFNLLALYPMAPEALAALEEYEQHKV
ncbi:MAG: alanine/glycine:cation symporter family protein [Faecalibacterium sp.]